MGGGDAAYDYALNLNEVVEEVFIIQRSKSSKSLVLLQNRVKKKENIKVLKETIIENIAVNKAEDELLLTLKMEETTDSFILVVDYLLSAIGRCPNTSFLTKSLQDSFKESYSSSRLYFIGDIKNGEYRQISLAIGDGIKAAMMVAKEFNEQFSQ